MDDLAMILSLILIAGLAVVVVWVGIKLPRK